MTLTNRFKSIALALMLVVAIAAGGVATVSADYAEPDADETLINELFDADNDTVAVWVELEADDDLEADNESVEAFEVDILVEGLDGNETAFNGSTIHEETVTVEDGEFAVEELDVADDVEEFDQLHLHVETDDHEFVNSTDWGTHVSVAGGVAAGGVVDMTLALGAVAIAVVILGAVAVVGRV